MDLNNIDIKLSARTNHQAVNLGFVLARRYKWPLLVAALLAILPFFIIGSILVWIFEMPSWSMFLIWWMKPFYDRVILLNLSQLIFNESRYFSDIVSSFKASWGQGLFLNLTFFRLSPIRSLSLPIRMLEGLSDAEYSQRVKRISAKTSTTATALTVGLVHIESILFINVFLFIIMISPGDYIDMPSWYSGLVVEPLAEFLMLCVYALVVSIIEVFYTCAGFTLYLNRRIVLEGWDIEIAFKKLSDRLLGQAQKIAKTFALAGILLVSMSAINTDKIYATAIVVTPVSDKQIIQNIIEDEAVYPYEVKTRWVLKDKPENNNDLNLEWISQLLDGLNSLGWLVKILFIGLLLAVVAYLVVNRAKFLALLPSRKLDKDGMSRPTVLFGLNVTKDSLPQDIEQQALKLINAGEITAAVSLLYRGCLSVLINDHHLEIHESYTEGDCVRTAQSRIDDISYQYVKRLTQAWQRLVYAHQSLNAETAKVLAQQWTVCLVKTSEQALTQGTANEP